MSERPKGLVPWDELIGFGLGVLRLSPGDFWTATLREIEAAARGLRGPVPGAPGRRDVEALM